MKIVQPTVEIIDHNNLLRNIELGFFAVIAVDRPPAPEPMTSTSQWISPVAVCCAGCGTSSCR